MLKNEIIKKIEDEFEEKIAKIKRLERQNYLENMLSPAFASLEKEIRELNLQIAKEMESGKETKELVSLLNLKKEQQDKIKKPLRINFECPKCKDSGFVNGKRCSCFNKKVSQMLIEECGVQTENLHYFKDSDFSKFEKMAEAKKIYQIFEKILGSLKTTKYKNFLIQGDSGVGKTFLLSCIAGEAIERGFSTFFVTAFNLNGLMLKYHTTFDQDRTKFLAPVFDSDVLIIDDLGTEQILKNVTKEYLLEILKSRVLGGKHTFISTNLSLDFIIDRYGERIFSRIVDKSNSLTLKIENHNLRLKK